MKTNEVVSLLNINRETLRYYEQQQLVHPLKGENGYRNYDQTDIDTLQLILQLRDLEVSLIEIKSILNNQLSIYDCLLKKEKEISIVLQEKRDILEKIQLSFQRRRVFFFYKEIPKGNQKENLLLFNDYEISIQRTDTNIIDTNKLAYEDIDKIEVSICTRMDAIYKQSKLKEYSFGGTCGLFYFCHIDFNIYYKQQVLKFESLNLSTMKAIFALLQRHNVQIVDPIGLISIFNEYEDKLTFVRTIEYNIRGWVKEFNIDNPRGSAAQAFNDFWKDMKTLPSFMFKEKNNE